MASLPARPASQRRLSPRESSQDDQAARTNSFSAASVDSQTVLLNSPRSPSHIAIEDTERTTTESSSIHAPIETQSDTEPRRCWICFSDENEDEETTSEWRSPCPCVLVAHEKCLLDWIADMEAPSSRRRAGGRQGKILCPQCKSEIRLQRPRSLIVDSVRAFERLTSMFLLPGIGLTVGSAAYSTLALIGRAHVFQIFGTQDAIQILAPLYQYPDTREDSLGLRLLQELRLHWRLHLGLPMIPTVLMLSRTTLLDTSLPFLPLIFFVSSSGPQEEIMQFSWPPSAAFTVAILPYIRSIYNAYYEKVWLPKERQWLKEIQPRADTGDADPGDPEIQLDIGGHDHDHDHDHDDAENGADIIEDAIEVDVDFDIFADWNNGGAADNNRAADNPPVPIARGPAHPLEAPPMDDDEPPPLIDIGDAAPAPNVPAGPHQEAGQPQAIPRAPGRRIRREHNIAFSTTSLADAILGALVFPSIAAAVGEALKYALPQSWVMPPRWGKPTGFLQARWGRSILGGCLFVGVKDAIMLYVRWRMARNHRMRRVLDYKPSKDNDKSKKRTGR